MTTVPFRGALLVKPLSFEHEIGSKHKMIFVATCIILGHHPVMANGPMRPLFIVCCAIALGACSGSGHGAAGSSRRLLDEIKSRGAVVVATEAAFEPFEFVQNGRIVGDVD